MASKEEALEDVLAQDAGYESFAEACADIEEFGESLEVKKLRGFTSHPLPLD